MRKSFVTPALASIAFVLVACSDVRVIETLDSHNYYDGAFEYATQSGTIKTVVLGSPFDDRTTGVADATASHMAGATLGRLVRFEPAPWSARGDTFRVVVLFNGKFPYDSDAICKNATEIAIEPRRRPVQMEAAFCQGDRRLSSSRGFADDLGGTDDPRFRDLVRSVTLSMIPAFEHDRDGAASGFVE